ncbi:MAG: helix-turn-helix domain-containing protein, partial [Halothiobacillus sp.]
MSPDKASAKDQIQAHEPSSAPLAFNRPAAIESAQSEASSSKNLGVLIREARAAKGLTPADLAQSLNLDLRIVELIEANRLDEAPEPIYIRAYLKHWAGLLDANPALWLAAFEAQRSVNPNTDTLKMQARAPLDIMSTRKANHSPHRPRARGGRVWGWLVTLLIVAGLLTVAALALPNPWRQWISGLLSGSHSGQSAALNATTPLQTNAPIPISIPIQSAAEESKTQPLELTTPPSEPKNAQDGAVAGPSPANPLENAKPLASLPPPPPLVAPTTTNPHTSDAQTPAHTAVSSGVQGKSASTAVTAATPETPHDTKPANSSADNLVIKANTADCWVEVRDAAGKRLVYDVLKKGSERSVSGAGPFSVILGNPAAVSVTWKG